MKLRVLFTGRQRLWAFPQTCSYKPGRDTYKIGEWRRVLLMFYQKFVRLLCR